ncbi:MAG: hypothetical protein IJX62_00955 [Clostridia bacterium]|nr:hypothetical protein [Clostridia bacterium]
MLAVSDFRIPDLVARGLQARGFSVLRMPPHPKLPEPVMAHPDILLFCGDDGIYSTKLYLEVAARELQVIAKACGKELRTVDRELSNVYPGDILLNALRVGKHLFCLSSHTAGEIAENQVYRMVSVRQGYAKCSAVPVGDYALITADPSIAQAAESKGLDVLRLSQHATHLPGYDTGFLGGASTWAPYREEKSIYFCGDLSTHPQEHEIRAFCAKHQKDCISLAPIPLTDVGTILLI